MGGRVGLCIGIFEACSAFTHVTACTLAGSSKMTLYIRGFSHFVTSMTAPIASGWSKIAGRESHPLENAAFARRTPIPAVRKSLLNGGFVLFSDPPVIERPLERIKGSRYPLSVLAFSDILTGVFM
jgi:hypothetical protein